MIVKAPSKLLYILVLLLLSSMCGSCDTQKKSATQYPQFPNTDGDYLPAKLPTITDSEQFFNSNQKLEFCSEQCITPFGQLLGEANGIKAYSNCQSTCVKPEFSFLNLDTNEVVVRSSSSAINEHHYIGLVHQCVEYARKWWMIKQGITFESITSAYEILYLTQGKDIYTNQTFPLGRSINGSAKRTPKVGDLLVYGADRSDPNWLHGHVAVVVGVDLKAGELFIAEENYNNRAWEDPKNYSRKIKISKTGKGYQVDDLDPHQKDPTKLGKISGWIYPMNKK